MMTTLSPQSTCGVKLGLCLPLRRSATNEARRPSTTPSASTRIHFLAFAAAAGVNETVDMTSSQMRLGGPPSLKPTVGPPEAAEYLPPVAPSQPQKALAHQRL